MTSSKCGSIFYVAALLRGGGGCKGKKTEEGWRELHADWKERLNSVKSELMWMYSGVTMVVVGKNGRWLEGRKVLSQRD